jgi:hypothetical protein
VANIRQQNIRRMTRRDEKFTWREALKDWMIVHRTRFSLPIPWKVCVFTRKAFSDHENVAQFFDRSCSVEYDANLRWRRTDISRVFPSENRNSKKILLRHVVALLWLMAINPNWLTHCSQTPPGAEMWLVNAHHVIIHEPSPFSWGNFRMFSVYLSSPRWLNLLCSFCCQEHPKSEEAFFRLFIIGWSTVLPEFSDSYRTIEIKNK